MFSPRLNRGALQILALAHVLIGKPASTFPGQALADGAMNINLKQFTSDTNAGDQASSYIVSRLSAAAVTVIGEADANLPNLIAIGSILHWADQNTVIWGTGLLASEIKINAKPRAIVAVRGPLTRARLIEQGLNCPELFGDPGVFISDFIPASPARHAVGLVPHYIDAHLEFVSLARADGVEIIDVALPIEEYIRRLTSCRRIVSSSLHGLVFAHAYGIPAVWVRLSDAVLGGGFKFFDYYASIGIERSEVPNLGAGDSFAKIEGFCALPVRPIDKDALRCALRDALAILAHDPEKWHPAFRKDAPPTAQNGMR